jgi:carbon monoxide dehydrogenase subunit G
MRITGEATLQAPVASVWDAILDPDVLVRTIPGCERLESQGEHAYAMTVTAGVAAIRGTYDGTWQLRDLRPHESLVMKAQGAGAPGTISAEVAVRFDDNGDGTTTLQYDADAVVGGPIAGVGQRMLSSVSRRTAAEFFGSVEKVLTGAPEPAAPAEEAAAVAPGAPAEAPRVYTRPPTPPSERDEFLKGVLVGAGLVLAGVLAGAVAARRRG